MKKKFTILFILVLSLTLMFSIQVSAQTNYPSYTYDYWRMPIPSASPFKVKEFIIGGEIDISLPEDPADAPKTIRYIEDFFVTEDHYYIIDMQTGKLIVTDKSFNVERVVKYFYEYDENDEITNTYQLVRPRGVYVTDEGMIYITDENNQRDGFIYVLNSDFEKIARYGKPDHPTYTSEVFRPNKIVVDTAGRMYIVVIGAFDGIVELQRDGEFSRFIGVQPVQFNPIDLLWRRFMSREQLDKARLFLPVEYVSMDVDAEGFIYATSGGQTTSPIQRINPKGTDVLRKNGYVQPIGDVVRMPNQNRSSLVGIAVNTYGMYSVLDRTNKKIFTYNDEGYLNYVTGFEGEFEGNFIFPTSIAYDGELLIVTDSTETRTIITVFEPTEFGALVNHANYLTYIGDSLDAADVWAEILNMNTNYSLAYIGIGHAYYRQKDFVNAMESYRLGQDRINYSKAYKEYRRIRFEQNFPIIGTIIFITVFAALAVPIIKDLRKES
jgi:hypothetical protein